MKTWKELSKAEKRVEIAKDILLSIEKKVIIPKQMEYLTFPMYVEKSKETSLQCLLELGKVKSCRACALGSTFISLIKFENKFNVGDNLDFDRDLFDDNTNIPGGSRKRLLKYFSVYQLGLIEGCFEMRNSYFMDSTPDGIQEKVLNFGNSFKNPKQRLIGIMTNIVENKGTFTVK
jgi:hypothetical protein